MGFLGGFFDKIKQGLKKTREALSSPLRKLFSVFRSLDDATIEELETILIGADVGVEATQKIVDGLRAAYKRGEIKTTDQVLDWLRNDLKARLLEQSNELRMAP